jgi:hypothetical protein
MNEALAARDEAVGSRRGVGHIVDNHKGHEEHIVTTPQPSRRQGHFWER